MTAPSPYITLAEAAALIPGANVNTLKRRARQGKLTVFRPGRAWLTTREAVSELVEESCRVTPKVRAFISGPPAKPEPRSGSSEMVRANTELDSMLERVLKKKKRH